MILARTPALDGGWLSAAFSVHRWSRPDGGTAEVPAKVQSFQDSYVEVDGVSRPAGR